MGVGRLGMNHTSQIKFDSDYNIYICGQLEGVAKFSDSISIYSQLSKTGYVMKLDSSGNVKTVPFKRGYAFNDVAVDMDGNMFVGGTFGTSGNAVILKFDSAGVYQDEFRFNGQLRKDFVKSVTLDLFGNVYCSGSFYSDSIGFNTFEHVNGSGLISGTNFFVAKLDKNLKYKWIKGGTYNAATSAYQVDVSGMTYDSTNKTIVLAGTYRDGTLEVDGHTFPQTAIKSRSRKSFVLGISHTGTFKWKTHLGINHREYNWNIRDLCFHRSTSWMLAEITNGSPNHLGLASHVIKSATRGLALVGLNSDGKVVECLGSESDSNYYFEFPSSISFNKYSEFLIGFGAQREVPCYLGSVEVPQSTVWVKGMPCLPKVLNLTSSKTSFCKGDNALIRAASNYSSYRWFRNGNLYNVGDTQISVLDSSTYNAYANDSGCYAVFDSISLKVNPLPHVNFTGLDSAYCPNDSAVLLTGVPSGGSFTGVGIKAEYFHPQNAQEGYNQITYHYQDSLGCADSVSKQLRIKSANECTTITTHQPTSWDFTVYPNPAYFGLLSISQPGVYHVLDITGKEVVAPIKKQTIDVSNLPKGMYVLKNSHGLSVKFIIQ